jgi:hypothetical protein
MGGACKRHALFLALNVSAAIDDNFLRKKWRF